MPLSLAPAIDHAIHAKIFAALLLFMASGRGAPNGSTAKYVTVIDLSHNYLHTSVVFGPENHLNRL